MIKQILVATMLSFPGCSDPKDYNYASKINVIMDNATYEVNSSIDLHMNNLLNSKPHTSALDKIMLEKNNIKK